MALLLALPLWCWWAVEDGGYSPGVWLPGVIYLLAAVAVLAIAAPRPPLRGARAVAVGALAALTAWSALSLLWADDPGSAWIGAERTLLLAVSFALPAIWPPSRPVLAATLAAWPLIVLAAAVTALADARGDAAALHDGRLAPPTGYPNATAALMLAAALAALALASARSRPAWPGALLAGAGVALLGTAALTQSRGGAIVAAACALALVAVSPARVRALAVLAIAGVALAAMLPELLDVRRAWRAGEAAPAVGDAARAMALAAAGAALATAGALTAVGRLRLTAPRVRVAPQAAVIAAAGAAAVIVAVATAAGAARWADERIASFRTPDYDALEQSDTRFTGDLGSNRSDYWRVALDAGLDRPLLGAGEDNFAALYLRDRRSEKAPRYAHGTAFETFATLGFPGLALLAAFAAATVAGLAGAWLRAGAGGRALTIAAALPATALALHGAADWSPAFPAVAAPAVALAGAALGSPAVAPRRHGGDTAVVRRHPAAAAAAVAGAALLAASAIPVLISAKLTDRAWATLAQRPGGALDDLRRARAIDPISARPPLTEGIVALRLGRAATARAAFAEAARRDSSAWFSRFALGLLTAADDPDRARRLLRAAARRNPGEPLIPRAMRLVERGRRPDARRLVDEALARPG